MISNLQLLVVLLCFLGTIGWSAATITIAIREQTKVINKVVEHLHGISHTTVRIEEGLNKDRVSPGSPVDYSS